MFNVVSHKNSRTLYINFFYAPFKRFNNKIRPFRPSNKNTSRGGATKTNARFLLNKKIKKYNFRSNYFLQKKNYYKFKDYKNIYYGAIRKSNKPQYRYFLYRSFFNFRFKRAGFFYGTHTDFKKEKKTLITSIINFKVTSLNDFFFKNTITNFIFAKSFFLSGTFHLKKNESFFLLSKNLSPVLALYLCFFNANFFNLKSFKFLLNFFYKPMVPLNLKFKVVTNPNSLKNLMPIIFSKNNRTSPHAQRDLIPSANFFFKSSSVRLPLGSLGVLYYFNSHPFHSKSVMLKKKSKLTAHPMEDFNSSAREAFTYCVNVSFNKKIDGEDTLFAYLKTKEKKFFLAKTSSFLNKIKKKKTVFSFNVRSNLISNFFFFLGRSEPTVPKLYYCEFSRFVHCLKKKNIKKNSNLSFVLTSCFFFNSFLFASIFSKKKKFFKIKKSFHSQSVLNNFSTNELLEKLKNKQSFVIKKNYFKTNFFNIKNIQIYSFFLSTKEVLFFIFSKPFFFKFFFWNFKNIYKKNFLSCNTLSFYFENLYKSFFQSNKNFKYSNVVPYRPSFVFKYKRVVQKDFSVQIFNPALTSFFYSNVASFLEYCSGKKIMLNTNSFLITYLDFDERATCALWTPRIRVFRKMLGPRLFLNESLTILYICIKLKDPYLLSAWMLNMFYKISFWKYKLLFRYLYYVLKYFMWSSFANKCIKGLRFQLKGKVSVAGNARTRTIFTSIGATGNGNLNKRVLTNLNLLRTFTGVIGFRTWLSF